MSPYVSVLVFTCLITLSFCGSKSKYKMPDCSKLGKSYVTFRLVNEKAMSKLPKSSLIRTQDCHNCLKPSLTDSELNSLKKILLNDKIYLSTKTSHANLYPVLSYNKSGRKETVAHIILQNQARLTSADLVRVGVKSEKHLSGQTLLFDLNYPAANKMADLTESNTGNRLAILINDKVIAVPVIRGKISAHIRISLGPDVTKKEAYNLYCAIRNGLKK